MFSFLDPVKEALVAICELVIIEMGNISEWVVFEFNGESFEESINMLAFHNPGVIFFVGVCIGGNGSLKRRRRWCLR